MAATTIIKLRCDHDGCDVEKTIELRLRVDFVATSMPGMEEWLPDGWTRDYYDKIFCPTHTPKGDHIRIDNGNGVFVEP